MRTCPHCSERSGPPDWMAREHVLWRNQHGEGIRLFCDNCGAWNDFITTTKNFKVVEIQPPIENNPF